MGGNGRSFKLDIMNIPKDEFFSGEYKAANVKYRR
jgi:hypothetical protein